MRWKINSYVKNSFVIWDEDAIVQHPLSGETLHLTGLAKEIFFVLSARGCDRVELLSSLLLADNRPEQDQKIFAKDVMTITKQLVQKELIAQCQ